MIINNEKNASSLLRSYINILIFLFRINKLKKSLWAYLLGEILSPSSMSCASAVRDVTNSGVL